MDLNFTNHLLQVQIKELVKYATSLEQSNMYLQSLLTEHGIEIPKEPVEEKEENK